MNRFIATLVGAVLLALGFMAGAAIFFVLFFVVAAVWLTFKARQLWARVTGKPVAVWSVGAFDPRQGFFRAYGSFKRPDSGAPAQQHQHQQQLDDVTDVVPREPSERQ